MSTLFHSSRYLVFYPNHKFILASALIYILLLSSSVNKAVLKEKIEYH